MPKFTFYVEYVYSDDFTIEAETEKEARELLSNELNDGHLSPEDNGDFESSIDLWRVEE